MYIAIRLLLLM